MVNTYSQKHKERLPQEAHERHQNLSEEENDKRQKRPEKDFLFIFLPLIPETWEMKFYHQYLEADIYLKDCL